MYKPHIQQRISTYIYIDMCIYIYIYRLSNSTVKEQTISMRKWAKDMKISHTNDDMYIQVFTEMVFTVQNNVLFLRLVK